MELRTEKIKNLVSKTVEVFDGENWVWCDNFRITGLNEILFKVELEDGREIIATNEHKFVVVVEGKLKKVTLAQLRRGDRLHENVHLGNLSVTDPTVFKVSYHSHGNTVYCCTIASTHNITLGNGIITGQCGEIPISALGGYCSIGDVVPYHCDSLFEFEEAARLTVRALMRVNAMDCVYSKEVKRTNRIGVSITGIHEYAWRAFGFGFHDIINEQKSLPFWLSLAHVSRALKDEAVTYAKKRGMNVPHTDTAIKPAGTTSKLFGLTEGAHLPAMAEYLRWVQFRSDDPLVGKYTRLGYPVKTLKTYEGTTIVGFLTQPEICRLGMGDKLVTASQATPAEQFQFLRLLEKYWIRGTDERGDILPNDTGGQVSYTMKYDPELLSLEQFRTMLLGEQHTVKCCSVMRHSKDAESGYEYLPEQSVTIEEYNHISDGIKQCVEEDVDRAHVACIGGACPVELKGKSGVTADCAVL